ncbi:MAG: phytoene desaturase family protein [Chitinivibrionales bacterium]
MAATYDAVVIGSGIGGLTCGAFLARAGMRVAVLEKHYRIGGYAHSFIRRGYRFESGIHSVPLNTDGTLMYLLRLLGIENRITPVQLPCMFRTQTPQYSFGLPSQQQQIVSSLKEQFPDQTDALSRFFDALHRFKHILVDPIRTYEQDFTGEDLSLVYEFHNKSYKSLIEEYLSDPDLQHILFSVWPYAGASPDYGAALYNTMMFTIHFFEGSHHLQGGFHTLADALASVITDNGGVVHRKTEVCSISADASRRATNVVTSTGDEFVGDVVISNISPYALHTEILDKQHRSRRWMRRLSNLEPSVSCVAVYCGMHQSFTDMMQDNILFWFDSPNHERIFARIRDNKRSVMDHLILLRTVDDPSRPALTLMHFVNKAYSDNWKETKKEIADTMIAKADQIIPGLSERIVLSETGSPETFERYTGNTHGALYGFENTKSIYGEAKMPITTHLSNLYQVGHWGKPGGGIWNVMVNAYTASKAILQSHGK